MTSVMRLRLPRRPGRPSRPQSAGRAPFGPSPWLSSGHQAQHLPDRLFLIGGFGHREVFLDLIAVAPPFLFLNDVAGFGQIVDDAVGAPLGYSEGSRYVAQADIGVPGDAQQGSPVVGEEGPWRHFIKVPDIN
jgi:hypothetical protein